MPTDQMVEVIPSTQFTETIVNVETSRVQLHTDLASNIVDLGLSNRDVEKQPERASKRIRPENSDSNREATVRSLLDLLQPLGAENPSVPLPPDLLYRTAERLESDLFNRTSKDRSVNALGRSSTLLSAPPRKPRNKYLLERDKLLEKVKDYVNTVNTAADIDQVQQSEIWDVIKEILEA